MAFRDLIKKNNQTGISNLRKDINSIFDSFFQSNDWGFPSNALVSNSFEPKVNISENEKEYRIDCELAGVDEKDIDVQINENVLTIKGEKKVEKEEKKDNYHLIESSYGSFMRQFQVPGDVETGKIEASFKKGMLGITLPKSAASKGNSRKVAIK